MADKITLDLNAKAAIKTFNEMDKRFKNPKLAMKRIAERAWYDVIDHFNKSQGETGKWKPLKQKRVTWLPGKTEPKERGGAKPLMDTGALRQSIKNKVVGNEAHVYTNLEYAAIHNFGGVIPRRYAKDKKLKFVVGGRKVFTDTAAGFVMPKRDFMWLSKAARRYIASFFVKYLKGKS